MYLEMVFWQCNQPDQDVTETHQVVEAGIGEEVEGEAEVEVMIAEIEEVIAEVVETEGVEVEAMI